MQCTIYLCRADCSSLCAANLYCQTLTTLSGAGRDVGPIGIFVLAPFAMQGPDKDCRVLHDRRVLQDVDGSLLLCALSFDQIGYSKKVTVNVGRLTSVVLRV